MNESYKVELCASKIPVEDRWQSCLRCHSIDLMAKAFARYQQLE